MPTTQTHIQEKKIIIFPLQWLKLLTDLQILGCELHKNAPGPAGGAIALPRPPSHYIGEGRGRKWLGIGRGRKGRM